MVGFKLNQTNAKNLLSGYIDDTYIAQPPRFIDYKFSNPVLEL